MFYLCLFRVPCVSHHSETIIHFFYLRFFLDSFISSHLEPNQGSISDYSDFHVFRIIAKPSSIILPQLLPSFFVSKSFGGRYMSCPCLLRHSRVSHQLEAIIETFPLDTSLFLWFEDVWSQIYVLSEILLSSMGFLSF